MFTVNHHSEITGSTWIVTFDKDYELEECYLVTKGGKCSKVKLTKKRDWLLWLFMKKHYSIAEKN